MPLTTVISCSHGILVIWSSHWTRFGGYPDFIPDEDLDCNEKELLSSRQIQPFEVLIFVLKTCGTHMVINNGKETPLPILSGGKIGGNVGSKVCGGGNVGGNVAVAAKSAAKSAAVLAAVLASLAAKLALLAAMLAAVHGGSVTCWRHFSRLATRQSPSGACWRQFGGSLAALKISQRRRWRQFGGSQSNFVSIVKTDLRKSSSASPPNLVQTEG
ncbi:hypothetical protein B0H16DRAFT_1458096 [Mycena metata]|uniref:Uncharacterized protein n=1 Tax=Mycena metata TaxID=1033252 RepID=A0AAD7J5I5_9AGAR|nr:hypothetical protein B0H16DRAFT_1458096 [Mycena metata]